MGYTINFYTEEVKDEKSLQAFISRITRFAYEPKEADAYHGDLTVHRDCVYRSYDEAREAILNMDEEACHDHIVKYTKETTLSQNKVDDIEAKKAAYIRTHSIHRKSSSHIWCPKCDSKLNLSYVKGEKCPLCGTDLRLKSIIDTIRHYDEEIEAAKKSIQ